MHCLIWQVNQGSAGPYSMASQDANASHAQVLSRAFELLGILARESSTLGKKEAFLALNGIVDKMSDSKLKGPGGETLLLLCEAVGPQFILHQLHKKAAAAKNPKVQIGCPILAVRLRLLSSVRRECKGR